MVVSTMLNLIIIPVLYVAVRTVLPARHDRTDGLTPAPEGPHA
jgi:hypothetical protein